MPNSFLNLIQKPAQTSAQLMGSLALTWGIFFILGGIPLLAIVVYFVAQGTLSFDQFLDDPNHLTQYGVPALAMFFGAMGQFPMGFAGLWLGNRFIQRRPIRQLLTSAERFRWGRLFKGMGIWLVLMSAYSFLIWLKGPDQLVYRPDWQNFWLFLPFALVLVPIQCAFEEIAIRGQFMQSMHGLLPGRAPYVPLLLSSLFFAILHSMNPEIATYGYLTMMVQYFTIGLIFGVFALVEEGLEVSIGLHLGNNLFAFLFVSYPGAVLSTPSMFHQTQVEPWQDFLALLGMGFMAFLILYRGKLQALRGLFQA